MTKPVRRFTVQEQAEIVAAHRGGATVRDIAESLRCDARPVARVLKTSGITLTHGRRPGGGYTEAQQDAMASAYRSGESIDTITDRFGVSSRKVVCTILRHAGVQMRPKTWRTGVTDRVMGHEQEIIKAYGSGESIEQVASRFDLGYTPVRNLLLRRGVEIRQPQRRTVRGGLNGQYVSVWLMPDDPLFVMAQSKQPSGGYVLEHRLVMARSLGRPLTSDETVHHVSGDKTDNRLENLQLRQGRHGKGARFACLDCGSHNVEPLEL